MKAPGNQEMKRTLPSLAGPGVLIREVDPKEKAKHISVDPNFKAEFKTSKLFTISGIPEGQHLARSHGDPTRWRPTLKDIRDLPYTMEVREQSSSLLRFVLGLFGLITFRKLALHFYDADGKQLVIEKAGNCGGAVCMPWHLEMKRDGQTVGRVVEDYDCYLKSFLRSFLCCIMASKVMESTPQGEVHRYSTRAPTCCCGRVDNCASRMFCCCPDDFILDVLSPDGELVSTIVTPYANGSCCDTYCSPELQKHRFPMAIEFPKNATDSERELLLTALFYHKLELFTNKGGCEIWDGVDFGLDVFMP